MKLDYSFQDSGLLIQAITHKSFTNEHPEAANNERLEFLGDAVVQLVVSRLLHEKYPSWPEGDLSKARSRLVREDSLANVARHVELGSLLRLGTGERASRGFDKDRVLADALEALIGAIFLDGGLDAAAAVLTSWLEASVERVASGPLRDVRSAVQEVAQAKGWELPVYEIVDITGPDHARVFTAQVTVGGQVYGPGVGTSKKASYEAAAALAQRQLLSSPHSTV